MENMEIVQIILLVFVTAYYLFSTFFTASLLQDDRETCVSIAWKLLAVALISPFITPIVLGMKYGDKIKEE